MPDEVTISIPEPHDRDDVPELLRSIAESIEEGNREGFHPRWALSPANNPDSVKPTACPTCGALYGEMDHAPEPCLPDYIWPDPHSDGWIDAWNGSYETLDEALADAKNGVGTPWVLTRGQGLISLDDIGAKAEPATESGYEDLARRALDAGLTDGEHGAADALADSVELDRYEREARAFANFVEAQGHSLTEILGRRGPEDLVLTRDRFSQETLAELVNIAFPDETATDSVKTWTYSQVNQGGADVTHGFTFTGTDAAWSEHLADMTQQGIEIYNAKPTWDPAHDNESGRRRVPGHGWHDTINRIETSLTAMGKDDRNDAIEALRSRFDELYDRTD